MRSCGFLLLTEDVEYGYHEDELIVTFDLPAHWLMIQMNNYDVRVN